MGLRSAGHWRDDDIVHVDFFAVEDTSGERNNEEENGSGTNVNRIGFG